eukprot:TCALIF_12979-PB protein Name:"Protein of unknown function" AED:0.44 eAED:1.00 QI:0/0/0/1/1/1/2/0/87
MANRGRLCGTACLSGCHDLLRLPPSQPVLNRVLLFELARPLVSAYLRASIAIPAFTEQPTSVSLAGFPTPSVDIIIIIIHPALGLLD